MNNGVYLFWFIADDLEVRFYEGRSDNPEWEGFGTFTQKDIHNSVAMTIKVPEYTRTPNPQRHKQQVMMELRKKSNHNDRSQSRRFYYLLGGMYSVEVTRV